MKKTEEALRTAMDRRLSFLDELPSCRPALMQRIAQEEAPVMKKKLSFGLVFALVLVSLSVIALATGLLLSPKVTATRLADRALEEKYGITDDMQTFFGREEEELPDGTFRVTYFGVGDMEAPLGIYTVNVKNGKAECSWNHDGEDTAGGYGSAVWGLEQLKQMMTDSRDQESKKIFLARATEIYQEQHPEGTESVPSEKPETEEPETFEVWYARREAEKTGALSARRLSEEEMIGIGREFIITTFRLTDDQIARLELYTNSFEADENAWYETMNGSSCFLVEYLLDEESFTEELAKDETYVRQNSYYKIYVNVETGAIEQYEYNSGSGGEG